MKEFRCRKACARSRSRAFIAPSRWERSFSRQTCILSDHTLSATAAACGRWYSPGRCLQHGEAGAAQLAAGEFVKNTLSAVFLLNRAYMPYYKWSFRALRALPGGEDLDRSLEWLLTTDNGESVAEDKYFCMEGIASQVIDLLQEQGLTEATCGDLEKHAYSVNDGIRDGEVRNKHILYCV